MNSARFVVFKSTQNKNFYFRLQAANGKIVLASEGYNDKAGCLNGIASVRQNAPDLRRYENRIAANGELYFVLKAANGEIIGKSETYESVTARDNGIQAVKTAAAVALIVDETGA